MNKYILFKTKNQINHKVKKKNLTALLYKTVIKKL